jgi:preprotein translocase subunit SecD
LWRSGIPSGRACGQSPGTELGPWTFGLAECRKASQDLLPPGTELLAGKESNYVLVKSSSEMTGAGIKNARVEMGSDYSGVSPHVAIEFNDEGTKRFADITDANVNRNLAIVLDGVVQSAPVIRTRIPDGHAIIEGQFTTEDAKFLKAVLAGGRSARSAGNY